MKRSSVRMSVRLSVPSSDCSKAACGFAAERPAGRRYRSIAAGTMQQVPELRSKCGQCHADSQRRRLHMDLFLLLRHVRRDFLMSTAGYLKLGFVELCAKILQIMRNDFKIMRALFFQLFLPLFAENLFRFCITHSRIQDRPILCLWDRQNSLPPSSKLRTFCIAWPDRLH